MSYIQSAAICTRVREVLEQSAGAMRTVPSGAYTGDYPDGLDDFAREKRALEGPRINASFALSGPAKDSPSSNGNLIVYDGTITITIARTLSRDIQIDSDLYNAAQADAMADADIVRQAIEYPNNLAQTNAAQATDIASGCGRLISSSVVVSGQVDDGAQILTSTLSFAIKVIARPAVS